MQSTTNKPTISTVNYDSINSIVFDNTYKKQQQSVRSSGYDDLLKPDDILTLVDSLLDGRYNRRIDASNKTNEIEKNYEQGDNNNNKETSTISGTTINQDFITTIESNYTSNTNAKPTTGFVDAIESTTTTMFDDVLLNIVNSTNCTHENVLLKTELNLTVGGDLNANVSDERVQETITQQNNATNEIKHVTENNGTKTNETLERIDNDLNNEILVRNTTIDNERNTNSSEIKNNSTSTTTTTTTTNKPFANSTLDEELMKGVEENSTLRHGNTTIETNSNDTSILENDDITIVDLESKVKVATATIPNNLKISPEIEAILNRTKNKENDYDDYDYNEPSLPPSLPNLK